MNYTEAMNAVQSGKKIARTSWLQPSILKVKLMNNAYPAVAIVYPTGFTIPWKVAEGDIDATDWVVIE